jgi:hypothetical protein
VLLRVDHQAGAMRPPTCRICGRQFDPDGGGALLTFRRADDHRESPAGQTDHPPHQEWFCADHVDAAREYTYLTREEALARLE